MEKLFLFLVGGIILLGIAPRSLQQKIVNVEGALVSKGIRNRRCLLRLPAYPTHFRPTCAKRECSSIGEQVCKDFMEALYRRPFNKIRPAWLINPKTSRRLELDCYNNDVKIAVEYNGIQHYEWPNFTRNTREEFEDQMQRDEIKKRECERNGVLLVVVPYRVQGIDIPLYIYRELQRALSKKG